MSKALTTNFSFVENESIVTREAGVSEKSGRPLARLEYSVQNGLLMGNGKLAPATALRAYTAKVNGKEGEFKGKELISLRTEQQVRFNSITSKEMASAASAVAGGQLQADTCLVKKEKIGDKEVVTGYIFKIKAAGKALKREAFAATLRKQGIEGELFETLMASYDKNQ